MIPTHAYVSNSTPIIFHSKDIDQLNMVKIILTLSVQ